MKYNDERIYIKLVKYQYRELETKIKSCGLFIDVYVQHYTFTFVIFRFRIFNQVHPGYRWRLSFWVTLPFQRNISLSVCDS